MEHNLEWFNQYMFGEASARNRLPVKCRSANAVSRSAGTSVLAGPHPLHFKCLFTSFVISNMLTAGLPKIGLSLPSALIMRRFFESWSPLRLM